MCTSPLPTRVPARARTPPDRPSRSPCRRDRRASVFSYTSTYTSANDSLPHGVTNSTAGVVYPSYDFSLPAECSSTNLVWPNEMIKPQHLHFLFDIQGPNSDVLMNGASGQQFTGIWYAPTSSITIRGAGKGAGGPPWVDGQMIMYDGDFSGNSYNDVVTGRAGREPTPVAPVSAHSSWSSPTGLLYELPGS